MIGGAARDDLVASIAEACRSGLGLDELRQRVIPRLRQAVPVDALWSAAVDPTTLLFTHAYREEIPVETGPYFVANEFLRDDANKWTELARDRRGVRTLFQATGGRPEQSARYRDIFQPLGLADELRAALRAGGDCWGYLCLHREGPKSFSEEEVLFVERVAPHLADGFRLALLMDAADAEGACAPGVVLLGSDGSPPNTNAAGEQWLDELRGSASGDALPLEVLAVAARLQASDTTPERSPRLHVRTHAGRWAVMHASWLGEPPMRTIAVIIEQAAPAEVLPLRMAAYGFTKQERIVTSLICQGLSTIHIAGRLHLTTNTIQDHLKSIFTKAGVRSRGELVAALLKQQYR